MSKSLRNSTNPARGGAIRWLVVGKAFPGGLGGSTWLDSHEEASSLASPRHTRLSKAMLPTMTAVGARDGDRSWLG
ncbi:hypothetical protein PanWU01x14_134180 [Parasponia andersonii]|uniref:Uncharacterized protein n=1 Tax=Parasponia andersonii TaxID=3476 RepID=A0A2P5CPL7_PARAD|nr:hypothetical protein PanWU01x14_134180 [Parasponia andersonii]